MTTLDTTAKLIKEITEASGVSGYEDDARTVMARHIKPLADTVAYDKLGSLIATKKGSSADPRVMIGGHLDEVGFMVKEVSKEGFIKFLPLGGWWGHVALGQRLRVITNKGPVVGIVGSRPPHLLEPKDRERVLEIKDMFLDIGAQDKFDVAKKLGVRVGDPIVPEADFAIMGNPDLYVSKAFDNRVSCALVIDTIRAFKKTAHPNTLFGVGTVQEEVGLRGAATAAHMVDPDVAIICDVGIAQDTPPNGFSKDEKLGGGVSIVVFDSSMIPNIRLRDLVVDIATKKKIKFHFTTTERGGTDGGRVHITRMGVPTVVVGIPVRYIHSHNGIMSRHDYDSALKLICELVKRLDKKTVAGLAPAAR